MIKKLDEMFDALKSGKKKRLIAAFANDAHTIEAIHKAVKLGIIDATLVGDKKIIESVCEKENIYPGSFTILNENNESNAAAKAVQLINSGKGDLIMKGMVSTDKYMRAILNKENGLMDHGAILTHISVVEPKNYHKLLIIGDVAIIPQPELKEKIVIAKFLIKTAHSLGIERPKVAVLAATEQILPKMQACVDATVLAKMSDRGQIKGAVIDGPFALDVAIDKESAKIKKIDSEVAGDADCILFPNIESGNVFYKFHTKLADGEVAAVVAGARVPAILSSRGDSVQTKLNSIALASLMSE
ncbi:MAG: phosphate butyryltransferase [Bacteroidales bacterium]|nr:phosphate butyryltransferase [Bacteroidales bacterium]